MDPRRYFVDCVMMDKVTRPDPIGGAPQAVFVPGAPLRAGIITNQSTEARIAMQQGGKVMYTVVTDGMTLLHREDHIRRESDGQVIRITSNAEDMTPPPHARIRMHVVTGEAVDL